jgi:hypothetical protein
MQTKAQGLSAFWSFGLMTLGKIQSSQFIRFFRKSQFFGIFLDISRLTVLFFEKSKKKFRKKLKNLLESHIHDFHKSFWQNQKKKSSF